MEVAFSGNGFEAFAVDPPTPLWIPGNAKTVTLRYKISDSRYALKVGFTDGWGRDRSMATYLAWDIRADPSGNWKTATFKVPADWVRPLRITGVTTHNWEARNVKNTIHIQVDDIEVETDIKDVDPKTGVLATWTARAQPGQSRPGDEGMPADAAGDAWTWPAGRSPTSSPAPSRKCGFASRTGSPARSPAS